MANNLKAIDLEPVLQWIRNNTIDGISPARRMYHASAARAGLPAYSSLQRRNWTWPKLLAAAGVPPRAVGRPRNIIEPECGNAMLHRVAGCTPATVDDEIELMRTHAEPPRPIDWPLFGIPTKTETFVVPLTANTAVRCTRQYFSLR